VPDFSIPASKPQCDEAWDFNPNPAAKLQGDKAWGFNPRTRWIIGEKRAEGAR